MSELERLRWKLSNVEDDLHYHLRQTQTRMETELENVREEKVDWCEFDEFRSKTDKEVAELKAEIERLVKGEKWTWNPDNIQWEKASGASGEYERSEDVNNLEFKALLKDLAAHNGKLSRDGWFYWTFKNGSTVGRKKKSKEA